MAIVPSNMNARIAEIQASILEQCGFEKEVPGDLPIATKLVRKWRHPDPEIRLI